MPRRPPAFPHVRRAADRILAATTPAAVGVSATRLRRLEAVMARLVAQGEFAGIALLAARRGRVFHARTYGVQRLGRAVPLRPDAIFRIHSMTKPVTGVALMMLYEEGRWRPDEPVAAHIPEFRALRVCAGVDRRGRMRLEAPRHPPTMRELMNHTAGFSYGTGDGVVDRQYRDRAGRHLVLEAPSPGEMIRRLARIPLLYQPGTQWVYSVGVDVQGYLVGKLSGLTLPEFCRRRIFAPLGMADTAFFVPPEKRGRFVEFYRKNTANILEPTTEMMAGLQHYDRPPAMPSGGGGLVSTAPDYLRFCQMLLNGGELDGERLLSPTTVKLLTANHLTGAALVSAVTGGILQPGYGFGFDFAVVMDPEIAATPMGKGTYYWSGLGGTWFWVDPVHELICIGMVQRTDSPDRPSLSGLAGQMLYQALVE
ncbi:MAG: beta-lactamase family protein [Opitutae bacterium]|nr:beta-lactamase family protein [Opitutae bacterium]